MCENQKTVRRGTSHFVCSIEEAQWKSPEKCSSQGGSRVAGRGAEECSPQLGVRELQPAGGSQRSCSPQMGVREVQPAVGSKRTAARSWESENCSSQGGSQRTAARKVEAREVQPAGGSQRTAAPQVRSQRSAARRWEPEKCSPQWSSCGGARLSSRAARARRISCGFSRGLSATFPPRREEKIEGYRLYRLWRN